MQREIRSILYTPSFLFSVILLAGFGFGLVSAVECGSTPVNGCTVSQNTVFNNSIYNFPSGIDISANGISLDCNSSTLNGTLALGSVGIDIQGFRDTIIRNCTIMNYQRGIFFRSTLFNFPTYNQVLDSVIQKNNYGIELSSGSHALGHQITRNLIMNNSVVGIWLGAGGVDYTRNNFVWNNNFINNSLAIIDNGQNNTFNVSFDGGNYYTQFDTSAEGCSDDNNDILCDTPYNLSGTAATKDYVPFIVPSGWTFGPQITEIIPLQVIEDVDLVNGKTTLIRLPINFTSLQSNDTITPVINLYWNNTLVGTNATTNFSYGQLKNIDFWYVPQTAGNNASIRADVNGTSVNGIYYSDTEVTYVDVIQTRTFKVDFVPLDEKTSTFYNTLSENKEFINRTYPLADNSLKTEVGELFDSSFVGPTLEVHEETILLKEIYKKQKLANPTVDRVVGIVPSGWFSEHNKSALGYAYFGKYSAIKAVIVEEGYRQNSAHELGHTFGLCDEYNETVWLKQDIYTSCPNGDADDNNVLDSSCLDQLIGCDTNTVGLLMPWNGSSQDISAYNFMGSANNQNSRWVSQESFEHLRSEITSPVNILPVDFGILISGFISKNGTITIDEYSYVLNTNTLANESSTGNYSLIINSTGGTIYRLNFEPSFLLVSEDGNSTDINTTAFSFVVPFNYTATQLIVKKNSTAQASVNRTVNIPLLTIESNLSGKLFSNSLFEINWSSSDSDNGGLAHAILFSTDNGLNYSTIEIDYFNKNISINSSNLGDCTECRIKILASDGINTNSTVSEAFAIDNDLSINDFRIVYQNNTERVFWLDINNTFTSQTIGNISWSLDTGQTTMISNHSMNISLVPLEEAFIFVYYNYTFSGNYTVTATAHNDQYTERRSIVITV